MVASSERTNFNFARVVPGLGLKLRKNAIACEGVRIPQASVEVLRQVRGQRFGTNGNILPLDVDIPFHELQRVLSNEMLLRRSLTVQGGGIRLVQPKTIEQIGADVKASFAASHPRGFESLRAIRDLVEPSEFDTLFKDNIPAMVDGFREEKVGQSDFTYTLDELCRLGDHTLNRGFVDIMLADKAKHDISWPFEALDRFRVEYPQDIQYHLAYAEFNFALGVYDIARDSFNSALSIGGISKAAASRIKARTREAEKQIAAEARQRLTETTRKIEEGWPKIGIESGKIIDQIISSILILGAERFTDRLLPKLGSRYDAFRKLGVLRDACLVKSSSAKEQQGKDFWENTANMFQVVGDNILGEVLSEIANGDMFTKVKMGYDLRYFVDTEKISFLCEVLESEIKADQIEAIAQDQVKKIADVVALTGTPKNDVDKLFRQECGKIMERMFFAHKKTATALFFHGKQDAAIEELRRALAFYREPEALKLIAVYLSQRAAIAEQEAHRLDAAGEKDKCNQVLAKAQKDYIEALGYDDKSFFSLAGAARMASATDDYLVVIDYCRRIIDQTPPVEEKPREMFERVKTTAFIMLGLSAVKMYERTRREDYLEIAENFLGQGMEKQKGLTISTYFLAEVKLFQGKQDEAVELVKSVWTPDLDSLQLLSMLINPMLSPINLAQGLSDELLDYLAACCAEVAGKGNIGNMGLVMVDFALSLIEQQKYEYAERLLTALSSDRTNNAESYYSAQYAFAMMFFQKEEADKATTYLETVIEGAAPSINIYSEHLGELIPLRASAYNLLAYIRREDGEDREKVLSAIDILKRGMAEYPSDSMLCNSMGVAYEKSDDFASAEKYYRISLETSPGFIIARQNLIEVLIKTNRPEEAELEASTLKKQVSTMIEAGRKDISAVDRLKSPEFYQYLIELFRDYKVSFAIDLILLLTASSLPVDFKGAISLAVEEMEKTGKSVPIEIKVLLY